MQDSDGVWVLYIFLAMQKIGGKLAQNKIFMKPPVLSAICEYDIPKVDNIYIELGDLRNVQLKSGLLSLDVREQLMVVKACIDTHFKLLQGKVPAFGQILHYELLIQTEELTTITVFNTSGKLISSNEVRHENPLILPNVNYDLPN